MPPRNLVPLMLLAILALATLAFAILGAASAPSGATVAVQNASIQTFGTPTGSNSFTMDIVSTLSAGSGTGSETEVRHVVYTPPSHMVVSLVGAGGRARSLLPPAAVACDLSVYASYVGGSTAWSPAGVQDAYARTESLATYSSRVPRASSSSCVPMASTVHGQVNERAVLRAGYLVGLRLVAVVPLQTLPNGQTAAHGVESETLVLSEINGNRTRTLSH